ncbi:hypothetical protein KY289_012840 [Solanum tuberosum]|nr:hypothetical protein KY289_012840 [Solanum tuberosum]
MVSTIYPASHYGCCMRYLGENIRNSFHISKVVTHFYKAAKAYDRCEFNDHFNQIRDLVPKAAETLERIGFHTWSKAFYSGNRRFALLFHQRRMELVNSANRFVLSIEKDISKIFDLDKIPCPHAMAALRAQYGADFGNQIYEYSSPYYSLEKYIMTYCEEIHLVPPEDSWIVPLDVIEREIPRPYVDQSKPEIPGSSIKSLMNLLYIKRALGNLEALYRKGVFDFFNLKDPTVLGMISQAADDGHIGASHVLAIISIFNGGESMREVHGWCSLFVFVRSCLMEGSFIIWWSCDRVHGLLLSTTFQERMVMPLQV